jgi:hypothetical protein
MSKPQRIKLADLFRSTDSHGHWFLKGRLGWARVLVTEHRNPVPGGPTHEILIVERMSPALEQTATRYYDHDPNHAKRWQHHDDGDETA